MNSIDIALLLLLSGITLLIILGSLKQSQAVIFLSWVISLLSSLSVAILFLFLAIDYTSPRLIISGLRTWYSLDSVTITFSYYLDPWSLTLVLISSWLTTIIVVFSKFYIDDDHHASRYYLFVTTFLFGMALLTLADSLLLVFFGWEVVGLCSWALIGHYFYKSGETGEKAKLSGQKALVTTGFADIGFVLGMFYLIQGSHGLALHSLLGTNALTNVIGLSFFLAAVGKSAQFPLHIWISSTDSRDLDAMQGPTTVSALIHAATMVNAGVYLTARIISIGVPATTVHVILAIGALTVIFAGVCALGTFDVKRVLAYSTISQLGYMITVLGSANLAQFSSLWHLFNHAMFKALLFLSAGTLIHVVHSRNLRELSGSLRKSKILLISFLLGFLSLVGFPLFSGYFSKDLIIEVLWEHPETRLYAILLIIGAYLTAAYAFRAFYYLYTPTSSSSDRDLTVPSIPVFVLSVLSLATLLSSLSFYFMTPWFENAGIEVPEHITGATPVTFISVVAVILGILTGWYSTKFSAFIPRPILVLVQEGFYIDHLLSWLSDGTCKVISKILVKLQTGTMFWNLFQFTFVATGIGIVYYWVQIGGVF